MSERSEVDVTVSTIDRDAELLGGTHRLLDHLAAGTPPSAVLTELVLGLEQLIPGSRSSVLLLHEPTHTLWSAAAPSLPAAYSAAIDGMAIGPLAGSCGTAAFLRQTVVVSDTLTDPRWAAFRHLAEEHGLRSCWSSPIHAAEGPVLGTFAIYRGAPHRPEPDEIELLHRYSSLAGVAIRHAELTRRNAASEELFRRSFEDNAAGMAMLDADRVVLRVNRVLSALCGRPAEQICGSLAESLVDVEDQPRFRAALERCASGDARVETELRLIGADQAQIHVLGAISVVGDGHDLSSRWCVSVVDLTERRQSEEERVARHAAETAQRTAEQASVAKGAFLAAMSHELRTPLSSMVAYSELLASGELVAERRRRAARAIESAAAHLIAIVDDVLDLAKIEAGAVELDRSIVMLSPIVVEVVEMMQPIADAREVRVEAADLGALCALADRRRLRQALLNIVANAVRYHRAGGWVRITATAPAGGGVDINVTDNGNGIPAPLREQLFAPFSRNPDASDDADGNGLGLMVSQEMVQAMGGDIVVADGAEGGTSVTVHLPA